jgi:phosphatidylserine synthase
MLPIETMCSDSHSILCRWLNLAGEAWMIIVAAYFVLLLVVSGVSVVRRKGFDATPLVGFLLILHLLWVIPFTIFIFIKSLPLIIAMTLICIIGLFLLLGFAWISGVFQRRRKRKGL